MVRRFLLSIAFLQVTIFSFSSVAEAGLKDGDMDGITDEGELNIYHTDPEDHDTDRDGFDDAYEIVHQTNPLDRNNNPLAGLETKEKEESQLMWWMPWVLGFLGFVVVSGGVVWGVDWIRRRKVLKEVKPQA